MQFRRGSTLASLLMVIGIALSVTFILAAAAVAHLRMASHESCSVRARQVAENAAALALEELQKNVLWGKVEATRLDVLADPDGAFAWISFKAAEPGYSTNNVPPGGAFSDAVRGWGNRSVPADAIHLVATGQQGAARSSVELIVHIPIFPYVVASSGTIQASDILVAAVPSTDEVDAPPAPDRPPGNLASNSTALQYAITMSGSFLVTGDIETCGGVQADATKVGGDINELAPAVALPRLDFAAYDPGARTDCQRVADLGTLSRLEGFVRCDSTYLNADQNLELADALLFVNGDLELRSIRGRGAVVVTGRTTLHEGANLAADRCALLSRGDVRLSGSDRNGSRVQGLFYTEGNLSARNATLVGVFIANNRTGGSQVDLENVRAIHAPEFTRLEINVARAPGTPPAELFDLYPDAMNFGVELVLDPADRDKVLINGYDYIDINALQNDKLDGTYNPARRIARRVTRDELMPIFLDAFLRRRQPRDAEDVRILTDHFNTIFPDMIDGAMADALPRLQSAASSTSPVPPGVISTTVDLDLSQFLTIAERMRVKLWQPIVLP